MHAYRIDIFHIADCYAVVMCIAQSHKILPVSDVHIGQPARGVVQVALAGRAIVHRGHDEQGFRLVVGLQVDFVAGELGVQLPDLQSRLTLALVFQLQELADEDKLRALQLRASRRGLQMPDEVGRFILTRGARSMSALFELLEQLDQASLQAQRKLTIPFLKETLGW